MSCYAYFCINRICLALKYPFNFQENVVQTAGPLSNWQKLLATILLDALQVTLYACCKFHSKKYKASSVPVQT